MTKEFFRQMLGEEMAKIKASVGDARYAAGKYEQAAQLFAQLSEDDHFADFLTVPAYELIA